jgi:acetylornithine deacetylase/succinyl-diaminopimelate desuccinylase-like protein
MGAAVAAIRKGFRAPPVFVRSGGSIPAVSVINDVLRIPPVLIGFALPDDGMHAANEHIRLANFFGGIDTAIWFLHEVASRQTGSVEPVMGRRRSA